jgi:hypothetical protein
LGISQGNMYLYNNISSGSLNLQTGSATRFSINRSGNCSIAGNLTVSGVLQAPVISLLGVSNGIIDSHVGLLGVN